MEKIQITKKALLETLATFALVQTYDGSGGLHFSFRDKDIPDVLQFRKDE